MMGCLTFVCLVILAVTFGGWVLSFAWPVLVLILVYFVVRGLLAKL